MDVRAINAVHAARCRIATVGDPRRVVAQPLAVRTGDGGVGIVAIVAIEDNIVAFDEAATAERIYASKEA